MTGSLSAFRGKSVKLRSFPSGKPDRSGVILAQPQTYDREVSACMDPTEVACLRRSGKWESVVARSDSPVRPRTTEAQFTRDL